MKSRVLIFATLMLGIAWLLSACGGSTTAEEVAVSGITVKDVVFAEMLDENYQAVNPKTVFGTTDTIYVSVVIEGRPKQGTLEGNFYYGDQLISGASLDFADVNEGVIFSIGENTYAGLWLQPSESWPVGNEYYFELIINGQKVGDFPYEVVQ